MYIRSSHVAAGAALALVNTKPVREFMDRAAIGVLVQPTSTENATIVWAEGRSRPCIISVGGKDPQGIIRGKDIMLVCCPLAPDTDEEQIPIQKCYDLQSFSKTLSGRYEITVKYQEKDEEQNLPDRLVVTAVPCNRRGNNPEECVLPLYYDAGGCVCFVDRDPSSQESQGGGSAPLLAPKRFQNKKGKAAYLQWEKARWDPAHKHWGTKPSDPELPLPSLDNFHIDLLPLPGPLLPIQAHDSDSDLTKGTASSAPTQPSRTRPRTLSSRAEDDVHRRTKKPTLSVASTANKGKGVHIEPHSARHSSPQRLNTRDTGPGIQPQLTSRARTAKKSKNGSSSLARPSSQPTGSASRIAEREAIGDSSFRQLVPSNTEASQSTQQPIQGISNRCQCSNNMHGNCYTCGNEQSAAQSGVSHDAAGGIGSSSSNQRPRHQHDSHNNRRATSANSPALPLPMCHPNSLIWAQSTTKRLDRTGPHHKSDA